MKSYDKNLFYLPALITGLGLMLTVQVRAQTFTALFSFMGSHLNSSDVFTNEVGATPLAGLILSGNALYGTAGYGGSSGNGTVFKINTDGTGVTNLYSFTAANPVTLANSDGGNPAAGLTLSGNTLYGAAFNGGTNGRGTLFAININGTGFTNLHTFTATSGPDSTNSDGVSPHGSLAISSNLLYGTSQSGGRFGWGTVFAIYTNGTGFTNLHSFTIPSDSNSTNDDGASPEAGLIVSSNALYGTTTTGGLNGNGIVFRVGTDGTGFTNLHSFLPTHANSSGISTNGDGYSLLAGLILSGNTLYGTAGSGGINGNGTVFRVETDGTGFTNLHSFSAGTGSFPNAINSDGSEPAGNLVLSGNTLYGTAGTGGNYGKGTMFAINTDGTGFTILHAFTAGTGSFPSITNNDGADPFAGLTLSGDTLYGTAELGGSAGAGTIFSLSFAPQLSIAPSGANVILSWPTNVVGFDYSGFTLQSIANLASGSWSKITPKIVTVGTNYVSTNIVTGGTFFFRLVQ